MNGFSTEFLTWMAKEIERSGLIFRCESPDPQGFMVQHMWIDPIHMLFNVILPGEV